MRDLKFACRVLAKDRGFTAVVILALALGIGANTTVFTLVNAVLFRGLPFPDPDRIVGIDCTQPSANRNRLGASYPDFQDWRAEAKSFRGMAAYDIERVTLSDQTRTPERYLGAYMSASSFSLIGAAPVLGRDFGPADEKPGAPAVVLIGYGIWESRFGGDPHILGQTVRVDEHPLTIIGVMPKGFRFPLSQDLWMPLVPTAAMQKRDARTVQVFARLTSDASMSDARAEMSLLAARLAKAYPVENKGIGTNVQSYNDEYNGGQIRTVFLALLGAVACVLLVACANVSNLILARSVSRAKEISIRAALGAGRWQIVRQLLVESVMLGFLGGALGLVLAWWGVKAFALSVANIDKPYWIDFRMDLPVFLYLAAICVGTGILFGLFPALQLSRLDIVETLKDQTRGATASRRTRFFTSALVSIEMALSLVLLIGAGLMIRTFLNTAGMLSGLPGDHLLVMRVNLPDSKYPKPADREHFLEKLMPRLGSLPGVNSVAVASNLPMDGSESWRFQIEGQPPVENARKPSVDGVIIIPGYFNVIEKPLLRGRDFTDSDGLPGKETAIVNQSFIAKYLPHVDPLAQRVRLELPGQSGTPGGPVSFTIIGICSDVQQHGPEHLERRELIYLPNRLQPMNGFGIIARIAGPPKSLITAFRREVQSIDRDMPVSGASTLTEFFEKQRWAFRVFGSLFTIFAIFALTLASIGLYAVIAYSVVQRTPEIGLRRALGAGSGAILRLVLRTGMRQLAIGLILGLLAALGATRVLSGLLVGVKPSDPLTFVSLAGLLSVVALIACVIPALRAARIDPMVALRYE